MPERVLLSLIGGRSATPSIMGALQFLDEIDRIKFLLCEDKDGRYLSFQKNVLRILKGQKKDLLCDEEKDVRSVDGNDFNKVSEVVTELCGGDIDLRFVNMSSAPQEMAFSVYHYVFEKDNKVLVFNVSTDKSQITPLIPGRKSISMIKKLTTEEYITACDANIQKKFNIHDLSCNEEQLQNVVAYFVQNIKLSDNILAAMRGQQNIIVPKTIPIEKKDVSKANISPDVFVGFLSILKENRIISTFEEEHNKYKYRVEKKADYAFIYGNWLEYVTYLEAKKAGFDSVEMGVELSNFNGEIDVFCVHNANALICECKTGGFHQNDLLKLEGKALKLGGNYCVRLFITSSWKDENDQDFKIFRSQAENRRIVIVSGKEIKDLSEILKKQMRDPAYPRY